MSASDNDPRCRPCGGANLRATVDVPARFRKSKAVGAVFGLTCSKYQSGEIDRSGRILRCGDEMMRVMLYEAAQSMLYSKKWSPQGPDALRALLQSLHDRAKSVQAKSASPHGGTEQLPLVQEPVAEAIHMKIEDGRGVKRQQLADN